MSTKIKDEPSCGYTDLRIRMAEKIKQRPIREKEREVLDAVLADGSCEKCGHARHDWLYAWVAPDGTLTHECNAVGQRVGQKGGIRAIDMRRRKSTDPTWLLLDLVAYTLEST